MSICLSVGHGAAGSCSRRRSGASPTRSLVTMMRYRFEGHFVAPSRNGRIHQDRYFAAENVIYADIDG